MDFGFLFSQTVLPLVWRIIGAIAVWIVGGWLIKFIKNLIDRSMQARKLDPTITRYALGGVEFSLRLLLVLVIFSIMGIETTSFAALLAGVGLAVGAAWGGLLANFAAGIFLVFLRPFKVGDEISAGGVSGIVHELGLLVTTIDLDDNVRVFVGNNKIFSDNIVVYSANSYRRVDLQAQLAHNVNPQDAIQRLQARLVQIPNVVKEPAPVVEILTFNSYGTILAVRPCCHNDHYWQVYFDTNKAIVEVGSQAGFSVPEQRVAIRNVE